MVKVDGVYPVPWIVRYLVYQIEARLNFLEHLE